MHSPPCWRGCRRFSTKPERVHTELGHCPFKGGRQDQLNRDINLGVESHDIAGVGVGSKHNKHKVFVKRPMLLEREPEENTLERPSPTSSQCLLESLQLVSALTNYLKWPSERFPVQTRPSPTLASALVRASLTFSTEFKTLNSFFVPHTLFGPGF